MIKITIENKQNATIKVEYADTFIKRLAGLVGKRNFKGLLFKQTRPNRFRAAMHTCFMKETIDIIFINSKGQVLEVKTLEPWKLYVPQKNGIKYILELPENSIKKYNIEPCSRVKIENLKQDLERTP